jgi:hypothetical protein
MKRHFLTLCVVPLALGVIAPAAVMAQQQGGGLNNQQVGGGNTNLGIFGTSAGDVLGITGVDTLTGVGGGSPLQTGTWETDTYNNMVGPEFGMLYEVDRGRWTFSSELKFTAAFNWQNNMYRGANFPDSIGADYLRATFNPSVTNTATAGASSPTNTVQLQPPPLFLQIYGVGQQNATNSAEHQFVFSPIGEWRFGGKFRVSQGIVLHAGYTGMWLGNIARASSSTAYRSIRRSTQYAEPQDPTQPASATNPWVVKTTGLAGGVDPNSAYYRPDPIYNRIGASPNPVQEYVFLNGIDFGVEFRY